MHITIPCTPEYEAIKAATTPRDLLAASLAYLSTMKMEALYCSEALVDFYGTARRHDRDRSGVHTQRVSTLKSS
jgi:hypothetical protein